MNWRSRELSDGPPPRPMPAMIWQALSARGYRQSDEIEKLFSPKLKDLRDPFSIVDMEKAIDRLEVAYKNGEEVCVYGDYDLDGTSGLALLKKGLEDLGFSKVSYYQPKRLSEGYGLHSHAVEKIAKDGAKVILTVDVGITAFEAAEKASELGIDLLITDHHLELEELPRAMAVVNPNRKDCDSGLGHLCGAGVGFYLILALRQRLNNKSFDPKSILDCFVIGTLTDLVPLVDENRVLVKHGLLQLAETKRPGLKYLLKELGLNSQPLNSQDVAIRFAPKLNALSRMEEEGLLPIELFLIDEEEKAKSLVKKVMACNSKRVEMQSLAEKQATEMAEKAATENSLFIWSKDFHRGVVGLVATRLSQNFARPSFVGSLDDETGQIVGSARGTGTGSLLKALSHCEDLLVKFGGHAQAAGFELELKNVGAFEERLTAFYDKEEEPESLEISFDGEGDFNEISPQFMTWYEELGPFGTSFEAPLYSFSRIRIDRFKELRGGHLKLWLRQEGRSVMEALWFSPPPLHPMVRENSFQEKIVDVLAEPQWNYFAGRKSIQLLIKDLKASE